MEQAFHQARAERQAADQGAQAIRTQLEEIATAGPIRALRLRRKLLAGRVAGGLLELQLRFRHDDIVACRIRTVCFRESGYTSPHRSRRSLRKVVYCCRLHPQTISFTSIRPPRRWE